MAEVYNDDLDNDENDDDFEADENDGSDDDDLAEEEEGEDDGKYYFLFRPHSTMWTMKFVRFFLSTN